MHDPAGHNRRLIRLIVTMLALTVWFDVFGQVSGYEFKRSDLKSVKKIVVASTFNDKFISKSIYYINSLGDIIKSESYDGDRLTGWTKYGYFDDGRIKYEEHHNEVFSYDEREGKHVGKVRADVFSKKLFRYQDNALVEIAYVQGFEGSETHDRLDTFEYNEKGQLAAEVSIYSLVGLVSAPETHSAVLDSLFDKGEATKHVRTHRYLEDSIVTTIYDESGKTYAFRLTKLNADKKPVLLVDTDPFGNKILSMSVVYDKRGNLKEQRTRIIDIDKIDYDLVAGDCYRIIYDDRGLPVTQITMENGEIISKSTLTYE